MPGGGGLEGCRSPIRYPQRRFTDPGEQRRVVNAVVAQGEDPTGKEAAGRHHVCCTWPDPSDLSASRGSAGGQQGRSKQEASRPEPSGTPD
ncbi:hypothetical protein [Streptomyces sp. NPDC057690]|uniref:hypothetical protein n=1 Tax=Streptomyces sp. NPDC057690 TaxID=3346214 RepID=UPI00369173ED